LLATISNKANSKQAVLFFDSRDAKKIGTGSSMIHFHESKAKRIGEVNVARAMKET
jgi:hypothetical protein